MSSFINRLLELPQNQSFFLFGARNTGKSTLIEECFDEGKSLWIDLLNPEVEDRLARSPSTLSELVAAMPRSKTHVVIDEVQKAPRLLDVVHSLIEKTNKKFILTGSSARKLKQGGANLLAGRAFVYHLHPFSYLELKDNFNLDAALQWGQLPPVCQSGDDEQRLRFLQAYALTYLKEEVWAEQLVRKLDPFRKFLEVAAQCNGKIINYTNIARDVNVDHKTVKEYYSILEDTLLGFNLDPFQHSFRKRLTAKPKFYFFDLGVVRALARRLSVKITPSTHAYGDAFEHFIILECFKLAEYFYPEYRFSYLRTKDDAEVDLVVERPGKPILFIEIKSSTDVRENDLSHFQKIALDFGDCEAVCFSNDKMARKIGEITVYPWREGITTYFSLKNETRIWVPR